MDERQRLICTVALHSEGFSWDEIATALGTTCKEVAALVAQGEKEQSEGRIGRWVGKGFLRLTAQEQAWLDDLRRNFQERLPGLLEDLIIHGPWARGIRDPEVEKNMLVIISEGDRETRSKVHSLATDVDLAHGFVFLSPLLGVITKEEWAEAKRTGNPFYMSAIREGVSVK